MNFFRTIFDNLFGSGENSSQGHEDRPDDCDSQSQKNTEEGQRSNGDYKQYDNTSRNSVWRKQEHDDGDTYTFHFKVSVPTKIVRRLVSQLEQMLLEVLRVGWGDGPTPFDEFGQFLPPESVARSPRDEILNTDYGLPSSSYGVDRKVRSDESSASDGQAPTAKYSCSILQTAHGPDGSIEKRKTTKDNEGNVLTVIKHQTADKVHTVVIKTDKNGVVTKTENFENMDPNELTEFSKKWKPIDEPVVKYGFLNKVLWEEFSDLLMKILTDE